MCSLWISEGLPPDKQQFYSTVTLADMDGDGNAEIIAATRGGGIKIFSLRENRWNEVSAAGLPDKGLLTPYNLYCLDLNGDGRRDIAVNYASEKDGSGGIRVYLNAPGEGKNKRSVCMILRIRLPVFICWVLLSAF